MYQIYVGCDWHLYSNKYDARHPYRTARSIGRLADNYGCMIDETDIFIFLGDLCDLQVCDKKKLAQVSSVIHNIKGYKLMCRGNHDLFDDDVYLDLGFDEICDIATAYGLVFSHVPVRVMPNEINIHAHLHHEKVPSLGYQHINAYSANFQKEDQPILVDTLLKEAPIQDIDYNEKWNKEVTEQFKQYTAIRDDVLHSKIIDISDRIPLYPVDEASAEMNEILFPDTDSTKYWEADDNTYQDELDAAEYSDARKPHKVRGKNDVVAESSSRLRVYTKPLYRITYNGIGIYEAYKKACSFDEWRSFINSDAATWLDVPKIYNRDINHTSYFTKCGYELFQKNTYPIIIQKLNKRNIKVDQVVLDVKPVYEDLYQVVVPNPVDESVYDQNKGYRAIAYDKNLHPIELKSTLHENISFTNSFPITTLDELLQEIIDYDDINDPLHEGTLMYDIFDNSNGNKYTLTSKDCIELLSSTNIFAESASGVVVDLSPLIGKNTDKMTILSKDIFDNFLRIAPEALDKEKIKTARNAQDLINMFNEMVMKAINTIYKQDGHLSDLDSYTAGLHILAMIYAHNNGVITKKTLKKVSPDLIPLDLEGSEFNSYIREVVDQLTKIEEYYINMVKYALTFIGFGYADSVNALKNLNGPNAIKMAKKYVDKNKAEFTKTYADGTIQYDFRHIHLNHVYIAPNLATDTGYANRIKPSRYIERAKRFDYCIFAHADSYIKNGKQMWTIPGGITIDGKQFVNMEDIVKYLNPRKHRILIMSCNPGHIEPNGEVFNNNVEYAGNDVILESSDIHQLNVHTLLKKWMDYTKHGIKRFNKIEEQILTIIDELELVVAPDAVQLMYGFKLDREEDITPKELRHRFADSIETSISTYMEFLLSSRIIARALMDKLNGTLITECTKGYGWAYSYNGSISTLPESTHTQLYPAIYRYPDKDTMFEDMALAELIPEVSTTINPLIKNEQISDCRFDYVDYTEQSSSDDKYYPTYHNIPESDWPNETALFIQTPHRNISTVESSLTESSVVRTQILGENLTLDSYRSDDIALQINGTKYKIKAKDILDDYINVSPEDIADCREEEIRSIDDLSDRLYKVLQSYGKHYEESCAGAKSLYNLMMIATDSNDPFSKPENKKLFRMMVEYFLPKGITDKQFNDLVHTRMRELKDIEYYLIKLLETNIALFGLEVTEVNALAMSSDRKKVIKDIKCRVDEQADKITDHRSSCTVYDFNQLYAGINCRVYIGNQLIHDAEQRGISTTPSRFLIRARKYDHIIATHAIANAKYDYEIQPIVMDNGTKVTTVNALLKELSLQNAKNVLLLICNPNAIDLDPIIDRYRMNVDYINPDSDGEGIIAIYESSANTALKYMSIMDELDSWNIRLKTTRKSIDHMECDLYDYMERYGYLTAPEKIYFAKLNSNTSHPIQVKDKTSIKYENYIKLRGYGVHLAFTYLKTLLYVTKLFIKYALHRYDRLVTEHASGYQAIMRNQLQMFDQEDQIATFSMQNKSYITESCIGPEDYLYQSMTELKEDIELYHWANTDNMMIQESSIKEYNRTDDNKPIHDRKESKEYAEKYGIRPIGQEEPDEKSSEEIERMKKAKQLQRARTIKKRKRAVNKIKQHLPFVKNEDATAVDSSDIMELDLEHSPLYGDRKHFFYNYDMPKEANTSAEKLDEMAYEDYCDHFYAKLRSLANKYNKRDDIFKHIAKILKMSQNDLPKFDCHIQVSSEKQLCFSMVNPNTPFKIKCEYEKYLKEMIAELEKDKETKDEYPYVTSIWTADAEGSIYINLDYEHINEAVIKMNDMTRIVVLNNELNDYQYGLSRDNQKIKKQNTTSEDYDKHYRVATPAQFVKQNGGICWDFATYEASVFKKQFSNIKFKTYYIVFDAAPYYPTHTFLVFEKDMKFYYFESSFKRVQGIWVADSISDIFNFVLHSMDQYRPKDYKASLLKYKYAIFEYNALHPDIPGSTTVEFMNLMEEIGQEIPHVYNSKYNVKPYIDTDDLTVRKTKTKNENDPVSSEAVKLDFYLNKEHIAEASISAVDTNKGFLYDLEVFKKYRGQGNGTKVMQYILANYKVSDLSVDANNTPAIKLYTKFGFKRKKSFYDKTQKKTFDWYQREPVLLDESIHKSTVDSNHKQHGQINLNSLTRIDITEKWRKNHTAQYPYLKHIASSNNEIDASAWLDDDKLVAVISVDRIPSKRDKIWIHDIHIDDKYRGYGLSKQLLDYAINNHKANALAVKIDNKLAQKVYLDYGFSFGSGKDDTMGNSKIMYLNESSIQESYQFELLDKNVHFYDKIDETASYQAKGKLYPVYVMLVHSGTTVSNLIKTISHSEYSHASISFDSSLDHMYSFARKDPKNPFLGGFRYESIGKGFYDKKEIPYALYVVPCTEDQVKRMKKRLDYFVKNNSKFSFDFAGLVKNYIGYADEPEYRWFCSRFVADVLNAGSPEEFKYIDEPSLMDPDDFKKTNFARFVIAGDNMMKYDRKLVDKLTKKILIEEKHRKQTGYTLAEDVIDPTIPYEDDILVYQLLTMDESVVDDVLKYLQSFKIKFDQDGNVIIHQREYKELSQHFNKSKRMLRHYRKTGATESIKNELCKLYYMINIIETYYLKPTTNAKYEERQKQMIDLRALMINVFRQNLNEVTAKEPNFNFQSYYNASDYGKDLKIPKTVIAATGKALITMLS